MHRTAHALAGMHPQHSTTARPSVQLAAIGQVQGVCRPGPAPGHARGLCQLTARPKNKEVQVRMMMMAMMMAMMMMMALVRLAREGPGTTMFPTSCDPPPVGACAAPGPPHSAQGGTAGCSGPHGHQVHVHAGWGVQQSTPGRRAGPWCARSSTMQRHGPVAAQPPTLSCPASQACQGDPYGRCGLVLGSAQPPGKTMMDGAWRRRMGTLCRRQGLRAECTLGATQTACSCRGTTMSDNASFTSDHLLPHLQASITWMLVPSGPPIKSYATGD